MKASASNITRTLEIGSGLECADNSGAKKLKIIGVKAQSSVKSRRNSAGIGDQVTVRVAKGDQEHKGEVFEAIIIRQRKEFQRPRGIRVGYEDNAAVLYEPETGMPKGNRIKGVVAKEVVERYPQVGKIASMVV